MPHCIEGNAPPSPIILAAQYFIYMFNIAQVFSLIFNYLNFAAEIYRLFSEMRWLRWQSGSFLPGGPSFEPPLVPMRSRFYVEAILSAYRLFSIRSLVNLGLDFLSDLMKVTWLKQDLKCSNKPPLALSFVLASSFGKTTSRSDREPTLYDSIVTVSPHIWLKLGLL